MNTSAAPTARTVVIQVADDALRTAVRDLAELAGALIPPRPWDTDLADPNCVIVLSEPLNRATLEELDVASAERTVIVAAAPAAQPPPVGRRYVLPDDAAALLQRFGKLAAAAPVVRVAGLHGAAGATRLAACFARLAAQDGLRVIYVDTDPRAGAGALLELEAGETYAAIAADAASWADVGDGHALLPLRLARALPSYQGIGVLTGVAPEASTCWAVAQVLRHACDLVVIDGCLPLGALAGTVADLDVVIGVPGAESVRTFQLLAPDPARILVLRTPGVRSADEVIAECAPLRAESFRTERHVAEAMEHGIGPGDSPRGAAMQVARRLWRQASGT